MKTTGHSGEAPRVQANRIDRIGNRMGHRDESKVEKLIT